MWTRTVPRSAIGFVLLSLLASGCKKTLNETPVGSEGQSAAKSACESVLAAVDKGDAAQVYANLTSRSQGQFKEVREDEKTQEGRAPGKKYDEKAEALKATVELVGRKAKVKEVRGVPDGVLIVVERADGSTRELSMIQESGTWKLHLFAG